MKPAFLRPQALRDQQGEVRYYRKEGGTRVAVKVAKASNSALDQIELDPGMGSPTLGKRLGLPGLRTWQIAKFRLPDLGGSPNRTSDQRIDHSRAGFGMAEALLS